MTDGVQIHRRALRELREAVSWYEARSPGLGWQLWDEVFHQIERAADRRLAGVRVETRWPDRTFEKVFVKRFRYAIYFERTGERLTVWAIAHGRRKPWYWSRRLVRPKSP